MDIDFEYIKKSIEEMDVYNNGYAFLIQHIMNKPLDFKLFSQEA